MAPKEYARVVKDLARLLCQIVVRSMQIKGLEGQILPLEPISSGNCQQIFGAAIAARLSADRWLTSRYRKSCPFSKGFSPLCVTLFMGMPVKPKIMPACWRPRCRCTFSHVLEFPGQRGSRTARLKQPAFQNVHQDYQRNGENS